MPSQAEFQTLFAYHFHTTGRLLEAASRLGSEAATASPGYGHGSIHSLLFHLLNTDRGWRLGLETGARQPPLVADDFPDVASLRAGFEGERAAWEALLERYTDEVVNGDHTLPGAGGPPWVVPRWRILQHLILHGMQHHAELAQALTANGESPGDLDFIFYR